MVRGLSELPFAFLHALVQSPEIRGSGGLLQLCQVLDQRFGGLDLHKRIVWQGGMEGKVMGMQDLWVVRGTGGEGRL